MKKILTVILLAATALSLSAQEKNEQDHQFSVAKNLEVFNTIYKQLELMYVDTLDADEVVGNGIKAMLRSLDPYTEYYPQEKMEDVTQMRTGTYAGVGAMIRKNLQLNRVMISEPYEGMPAAEAGLRRGDVILAIDEEDMTSKDVGQVSSRLRGDAGTSFILKIERPGVKKPMKVKVTRRAIQLPVIPYYGMLDEEIGILNLNQFTQNCSRDVRRALLEMVRGGMKKLILDLRNNGGGSEQEAVNIVNMFVPKGKLIVSNRGKLKQVNRDFFTTVEPIDSLMPVVVLVNGESASASEITAGALQDLDRAVIVGTRTYGKGLVQMTMDLPYNGTLKLTTDKYYIPSGRCIQAINYRHAQGGYVEHVPDSLTKVFHTAGGREVRDGGGISPDIVVTPDSMTNIVAYLMYADSAEVVHNYILEYVATRPPVSSPRDFSISNADFEVFKQRVLKSKFRYDRSTESYLESLEKLARFEGYYDDAKEEFAQLRAKLKHNVEKDLDYNRETLKQMISNEIVTFYNYQRGSIENSMSWDNQMQEAVRLLRSPEEYKSKLTIDH